VNRTQVLVLDTREKIPLLFPRHLTLLDPTKPVLYKRKVTVRLHCRRDRLETGDYVLQGHPHACIIERKGSLREVAGNTLTRDRPRLIRALDRLRAACAYPCLLLEGRPSDLSDAGRQPEEVLGLDALQRLLTERRISLVLMPSHTIAQRRATGEWVARLLINGALGCPSPDSTTPETPVPSLPTDTPLPPTLLPSSS
jgi:ERCC4-type nuclease